MKKDMKISAAVTLVGSLLVAAFLFRFPSDPLVYCQKALDSAFEQWKIASDTFTGDLRYLPNVDGRGKESLALVSEYMGRGYADGVLRDYGYVPGLREGDPNDLVMLYLKKRTRRNWNGDHSGTIFRKPKWMVIGPEFWDDTGRNAGCYEGGRLEETPVFAARLLKTLQFLKENNRPFWENAGKEHTAFLVSIGALGLGRAEVHRQHEAGRTNLQQAATDAPHVTFDMAPSKCWRYRLMGQNGNARLDMSGLAIVFEGVPYRGLSSGGIRLSGQGTSSASLGGSGGPSLQTAYANGVATLSFSGHTFRLLDEGRCLVFGDQEFRIGDDRPTLLISKSGTATMTTNEPEKALKSSGAPAPQDQPQEFEKGTRHGG